MALNNTAKGVMLTALAAVVGKISMHSADPGVSGTTAEITGGSPAYARKSATFTVSANVMSNSGNVVFDMPPSSTAAYVGFWDAAGTTFYGSSALTASEAFAGQGTYTLSSGQGQISL